MWLKIGSISEFVKLSIILWTMKDNEAKLPCPTFQKLTDDYFFPNFHESLSGHIVQIFQYQATSYYPLDNETMNLI